MELKINNIEKIEQLDSYLKLKGFLLKNECRLSGSSMNDSRVQILITSRIYMSKKIRLIFRFFHYDSPFYDDYIEIEMRIGWRLKSRNKFYSIYKVINWVLENI